MTNDHKNLIRQRLQPLMPTALIINDESHLHKGHAGNRHGASHFCVYITSHQFSGLTRIQQQRLVFEQLSDLIPFPIHALTLHTKAPI